LLEKPDRPAANVEEPYTPAPYVEVLYTPLPYDDPPETPLPYGEEPETPAPFTEVPLRPKAVAWELLLEICKQPLLPPAAGVQLPVSGTVSARASVDASTVPPAKMDRERK